MNLVEMSPHAAARTTGAALELLAATAANASMVAITASDLIEAETTALLVGRISRRNFCVQSIKNVLTDSSGRRRSERPMTGSMDPDTGHVDGLVPSIHASCASISSTRGSSSTGFGTGDGLGRVIAK